MSRAAPATQELCDEPHVCQVEATLLCESRTSGCACCTFCKHTWYAHISDWPVIGVTQPWRSDMQSIRSPCTAGSAHAHMGLGSSQTALVCVH
jgi:hypothetical protein